MLAPGRRWDANDVATPLAEHHTAFVFPQADAGSSIAGHGARLARSKCAQSSGDRLRCTTCHDPHGAKVTRSADVVCAECHQDKHCADPAGRTNQAGCVGCHMVKTVTTDIPHVRITDHFIQRKPSAPAAKTVSETLVPARALPDEMSAEVARGQAMIKAGRLRHPSLRKAGVAVLAQALARRVADVQAWMTLGSGYLAIGDDASALSAFEQGLARDPKRVLIREEHAYAAAGAGQLEKAVASLRQAVSLRPDFAVGLGLLGNMLCRMNRCNDALPFLARAERSSPSDSTLAFNHAAALLRTGRVGAALTGFARAMALDPLNDRATVEWAQLALAKGETAAAAKALSGATKRSPSAPEIRRVLARALMALGDLGEAAFQLDRYIALAPKDPNGYLERARVAHRAGDRSLRRRDRSSRSGAELG